MPKGKKSEYSVTFTAPKSLVEKFALLGRATNKTADFYIVKAMKEFVSSFMAESSEAPARHTRKKKEA